MHRWDPNREAGLLQTQLARGSCHENEKKNRGTKMSISIRSRDAMLVSIAIL